MEIVLLLIAVIVFLFVGSALGILAWGMARRCLARLDGYDERLRVLKDKTDALEKQTQGLRPASVEPEPAATLVAPPRAQEETEPTVSVTMPAAHPPSREAIEAERPSIDWEWWAKFEENVGKRWITWVGVIVLFLGAAFFVKYAFEQGWLEPRARVVLGIMSGIGMLVLGGRFARRQMSALGQGLMGGGLAVLYLSLFAAFSFYNLIGQPAAFALMVVVSAVGMTLAVVHDGIAVSFLAVLGGLLTPVMLRTGQDARDALFTYLVLLNLAVLGVGLFKRWRALDVLAFVGTWLLFSAWFAEFYAASAMAPTLLWLATFYLIFLVMPFPYHLRHCTPTAVERFTMSLANASVSFGYFHWLLHADHRHGLGWVALGMSACYLASGILFRKRVRADERGFFGFIALAVTFLTMAVPLHLKLHGITLAWAAEAPVLLYFGYKYRYRPVRIGGFAVLLLSVVRLFSEYWDLHASGDRFALLFNRDFASAMCVPLGAAAYAWIHHWRRRDSSTVDRTLKVTSAIVAGFAALFVVQWEVSEWLQYHGHDYLARCAVTVLWAFGSAAFLGVGLRARSVATRVCGFAALFIAAALAAHLHALKMSGHCLIFTGPRFLATLIVVLTIFAFAFLVRRYSSHCTSEEQQFGRLLSAGATFLLLANLSVEVYTYWIREGLNPTKAKWLAQMSLSILWGVYASALLAIGFWRRIRPLRFAALALFGLTALKLILVDMAAVKQIYRIIAFVVMGVLMIGASYLYHRLEQRLVREV